ncbi:discoidin, CUB and LCCL domain-containing protein 1-like [Microcaecilia unicolor]|uniref:Discoidin, CUB and LCCL domain-containing protein 1-like n=1 Tax=Microcaecilia unicolor TaxID=1415580 RepID=A0A6P7ZC01_9AMPH|nr:discoidin, CUB and LCCL domain-containing protein 1-like [Microcaecilia unicolor]
MSRAKRRAAACTCRALLQALLLCAASAQKGDGCGHTVLSLKSGTLASKNYPGTYPNQTLCEWSIQVAEDNDLLLNFGDFDVEYSEGCVSSFIWISSPSSGISYGPYCGTRNSVPKVLRINSSAVTILFNSTIHRSGRGFLLSYANADHQDLISCLDKGIHYHKDQISVYCPAGCKNIAGDIWGEVAQGYRDTSVICKAAVHAGVISDDIGGQVTLSREKGITLYEPAWANGLQSKTGSLSEKRLMFHRVCNDILNVAHFNASSSWKGVDPIGQHMTWSPERANFRAESVPSSWVAEYGHVSEWLEIDLGGRRNITGIITKGSADVKYNFYVTSYKILSSQNGRKWRVYKSGLGKDEKVFEGNQDPHLQVYNVFIPPILAQYLRVAPQTWNQRIALNVALVGCQASPNRGIVFSVPIDISGTTRSPTGHPTIPAVAMSPERKDPVLLVVLIIASVLLATFGLILLVFLCRKKRKSKAEVSCSFLTGCRKTKSGQACCRGSGQPCSSERVPYTVENCVLDPKGAPVTDYAEPDLVQVLRTTQKCSSTFKPDPDEGYMLPLVVSHYDVPGKYHEYAEPLPPEPEYATPFADQGLESATSRKNICVVKVIPLSPRNASVSSAALSAQSPYDFPVPHGNAAEERTNGTEAEYPRGYSTVTTVYAEPQSERTASTGRNGECREPVSLPSTNFQGGDPEHHIYHEPL